MSNQPPNGYPPGGPQGYQGGGYPPPSAPTGKTKVMNLDYNVAGLLCYMLPCLCLADLIFCILWLATEPKESRFVRFHAIQGLLLFGLGFVVGIIFQILGTGMAVTTSGVVEAGGFGLLLLVRLVVGVALLALYIICMIKAYQGQMWKLPIIGDIAEKNA
ncbi:MAG: hypothetical protein AABO57_04500 [Acidobacteriota bacterium]